MARPVIAVATEDFEVYLDLAAHLRSQAIPFVTLAPGQPVPGNVRVVITTQGEEHLIPHPDIVLYTTPRTTVEETISHLKGLAEITELVIGVDPGERPGIAVVADGHVLSSRQIADPTHVAEVVARTANRYTAERTVARVGHGAGTLRDRIVNALLEAEIPVELVDETSTSPPRGRLRGERDAAAARAIALTPGQPVESRTRIRVPAGEVRELQRRSRLRSQGDVTISKDLARQVARGTISLSEAVRRQQAKRAQPP